MNLEKEIEHYLSRGWLEYKHVIKIVDLDRERKKACDNDDYEGVDYYEKQILAVFAEACLDDWDKKI
jgi:hypothetical protein